MTTPDFYSAINKVSKVEDEEPDFYSLMEKSKPKEPVKEHPKEKKKSFYDEVKEYFASDELGKTAVMSAEMMYQPEAIPQMLAGGLEGLTLGAVDIAQPKTEHGQVYREIGRFQGLGGPISLIHRMFRPLGMWGSLAGAATSGAAVEAGKEYFKGEEMDPAAIATEAAIWTGLEGSLLLGQMVGYISRATGRKPTEVMKFLWNKVKSKIKNPFKKPPTEEEIISGKIELNPEVEEAFVKEAENEIRATESKEEVKPPEEPSKPPIETKTQEPTKNQPKTIKEPPSFEDAEDVKNTIQKIDNRLQELKNEKYLSADNEQEIKTLEKMRPGFVDLLKEIEETGKVEYLSEQPSKPEVEKPLKKQSIRKPNEKLESRRPDIMGKAQAKKRSDIIKIFRKAFNDPIRLGKFKQHASGIHKLWPKVTRLLKDNDIETAAHEIGHNLHTTLYGGDAKNPTEQRTNINNALKPYLDELKPLAHYEPFGMEGFAEFTRLYVTNPDIAQEMAPKFYAKFEADLEAQYPEMKNALLQAREYYGDYLQGTPESRIRAQTDYAGDRTFLENIKEIIEKNLSLDNLKTQFLDDVFPAKRVVAEAFGIALSEVENLKDPRNLYRSLRVLKGAVGKADVFLLHETFDAKTLKRRSRSLRSILRKLKTDEEYKEFNDYLIARRAVEKTLQNVETGISLGDAIEVEHKLAPKYKRLANLLDDYNDALLSYARESGLLSSEQYRDIKKNNMMYVPFQRVMEKEKGGAAATSGKLQAGKPIKRMKGSTRDIIAPIESVIKNTYSIIINAEKNLSGQVLAELAKMKNVGRYVERVPTPTTLKAKISGKEIEETIAKNLMKMGFPDLVEVKEVRGKSTFGLREDISSAIPETFAKFGPTTYPAGENIVTVYFDGKPVYYEVSPEIFEMWTKGIAPYTAGLITKIARIPARALRAGAILNPKFIQKNVVRDTWGSWLFTKYGKSIKDPVGLFLDTIYAPLANLSIAAKQGKLYVQWMKAGGGMSTMQSLDRDAIVKKLQEVREGIKPHQVIKWLRHIAQISEEANRLAEFGRALQVEGQTRLGHEISAFAGRDLSIDFAKMGLMTKAWNQVIPFFNATIQGTDKLVRTLASDKDRAEFLLRGVSFIVIPALIFAWLNQDDDRVKEFQEQEKDFNFITFIGDNAIKIPVPFETGVILNGLTQRLYNFFMSKDKTAFEGYMGSVLSAMLPNIIPTATNPIIETWANRNFFTGARIVPESKKNLVAKYQYKNNTSTTARVIGRAMAYMLGQDTRNKAASPAVIDHFINSWTGGLGRIVVAASDAALEIAGMGDQIVKPQQTITERLQLDAFSARFPRANTRSIEKFYDYYADATARQRSIKLAKKEGLETEEEIGEAYQRIDKIYNYQALQAAYRAMQKSQRAINNIYKDPELSAQDKRTFIDELYLQQIEFCKAVNEDIRKYRLAREKSS